MRTTVWILSVSVFGWLSVSAAEPAKSDPKTRSVDFNREVLPILEAKCIRCHGAKSRRGGLDMRTPAAMLRGGNSGPAYKPGNAENSLLIELIHFNEIPPKKDRNRITPQEMKLLKAWIDASAPAGKQSP